MFSNVQRAVLEIVVDMLSKANRTFDLAISLKYCPGLRLAIHWVFHVCLADSLQGVALSVSHRLDAEGCAFALLCLLQQVSQCSLHECCFVA